MKLTDVDKGILEQSGYLLIPKHHPECDGTQVAIAAGELLSLGSSEAVHELTPLSVEQSTPNSYSGIYGHNAFPFHTDLAHWRDPPRYLMLRCVRGFREVPTLLLDGFELIDEIGRTSLRRALVRPRRPIAGQFQLLRILDERDERPLLRWDEVFIRPASDIGESSMAKVRAGIQKHAPIAVTLVEAGDTLLVDNWRMLHARSVIPEGCESRVIERAYLGRLN